MTKQEFMILPANLVCVYKNQPVRIVGERSEDILGRVFRTVQPLTSSALDQETVFVENCHELSLIQE